LGGKKGICFEPVYKDAIGFWNHEYDHPGTSACFGIATGTPRSLNDEIKIRPKKSILEAGELAAVELRLLWTEPV
jgi:hypothetical protein